MPSNKPIIAVRTTEEVIKKFNIICEKEKRSMSKQAEKMIIELIEKYESEHGVIKIQNINIEDNHGTINM